jgi:hypothetical protein
MPWIQIRKRGRHERQPDEFWNEATQLPEVVFYLPCARVNLGVLMLLKKRKKGEGRLSVVIVDVDMVSTGWKCWPEDQGRDNIRR